MKINDVFTTLKVEPRTGWLVIGLVVIAIAAVLFLSLRGCGTPETVEQTQVAADAVSAAQKQLEESYRKQIAVAAAENAKALAEKDTQIKDFKSRLFVSEAKYKTLASKYNALQKEKENVQPPKTDSELRDRFTAAGFPPLPAK